MSFDRYSGQQLVLQGNEKNVLRNSAGSYGAGIATLLAVYQLQQPMIRVLEGSEAGSTDHSQARSAAYAPKGNQPQRTAATHSSNSNFIPPHKSANAFQPPQTMGEVFQRMGRPVLARCAAGSVAFFCAGAIQTYMAAKTPKPVPAAPSKPKQEF